MKKIYLLICLIIFIMMFFCGCEEKEQDENPSENYINYQNQEYKFSIDYPANWSKTENPTIDSCVVFASRSNELTKIANLLITVLSNDSFTMDWFKTAHVENLTLLLEDFTLVSESSTSISGLPGYNIVFTFTNEEYTWRQYEVWTIKDKTLYLLVHQADQAYYENFTSDIDHMIESFTITNGEQ